MGGGESLFLDAGTLKIFKFILESSSFRSENVFYLWPLQPKGKTAVLGLSLNSLSCL